MEPAPGAQAASPQAAPASGDDYLSAISRESLEVLDHFGAEAPAKLNQYSCSVEDALFESLTHQKNQAEMLGEYAEYVKNILELLPAIEVEREQYRTLLTDPAALSSYVSEFFGPNGPHPVQLPGEQARQALIDGLVQPTGPMMPNGNPEAFQVQQQALAPQAQQQSARPQMFMPAPGNGAAPMRAEDAWQQFGMAADTRPDQAWMVLDQMTPEQIRAKILFAE
jgi:hypothetical protein